MQKLLSQPLNVIFYYLILCFLWLARIYQLWQAAPFDYDSVYNYQILEQIAQKNYQNIFHHASPVLYAIFSIFYIISSDFWFLLYCNAFVATLGIHIFVATFSRHNVILLAFLGLSLLLVASSRYLSIESISLLGSALFWNKIKFFFHLSKNNFQKNQKLTSSFSYHFFAVSFGIVVLLLLLCNYKALIPIFFALIGSGWVFFRQEQYKTLCFKVVLFTMIYFLIALLVVMLVGFYLGQRWYQYPATLFAIVGAVRNTSASSWDFGYYFRYIFLENPFLPFLIAFALIDFLRNYSKTCPFQRIVWWVFLGTFATMTLFAKAPRGLIFCLPLGYVLAINWAMGCYRNLKIRNNFLAGFLVGMLLFFQIKNLFSEIYAYTPTHYPKVAQYLNDHQADVVFSTLGLSVYPYLGKNIKLVLMREAKDSVWFKRYSGNKFLLYDAYAEVSNHQSLIALKNIQFDTTFSEKSLTSKMLYLETSQYNGFTFSQSLEKSREAQKAKFQIGIKKL